MESWKKKNGQVTYKGKHIKITDDGLFKESFNVRNTCKDLFPVLKDDNCQLRLLHLEKKLSIKVEGEIKRKHFIIKTD